MHSKCARDLANVLRMNRQRPFREMAMCAATVTKPLAHRDVLKFFMSFWARTKVNCAPKKFTSHAPYLSPHLALSPSLAPSLSLVRSCPVIDEKNSRVFPFLWSTHESELGANERVRLFSTIFAMKNGACCVWRGVHASRA